MPLCVRKCATILMDKNTALPFVLAVKGMDWIFWLYTLNSCLNPWIYMAFNPELIHTLFGGPRRGARGGGSAVEHRVGNYQFAPNVSSIVMHGAGNNAAAAGGRRRGGGNGEVASSPPIPPRSITPRRLMSARNHRMAATIAVSPRTPGEVCCRQQAQAAAATAAASYMNSSRFSPVTTATTNVTMATPPSGAASPEKDKLLNSRVTQEKTLMKSKDPKKPDCSTVAEATTESDFSSKTSPLHPKATEAVGEDVKKIDNEGLAIADLNILFQAAEANNNDSRKSGANSVASSDGGTPELEKPEWVAAAAMAKESKKKR